MNYSSKQIMTKLAVNKSLLKEYSSNESERTVYLNNGDEFQIQLFNPLTETIGAEITINGETIEGRLILRPGERVWLERYLNNAKKFKFSTYEVDGDPGAQAAIARNGNIRINFYKEYKPTHVYVSQYTTSSPWSSPWTINPLTTCVNSAISSDCTVKGISDCDLKFCEDAASISNSDLKVCANDTATSARTGAKQLLKTATNAVNINGDILSTTLGEVANTLDLDFEDNVTTYSDRIETGRIEAGSHSDQTFSVEDKTWNSWPFQNEEIKILPMSRKPYTASDLRKIYCTQCGRKLNEKYKFCPYCGAKCIVRRLIIFWI